MVNATSQPLYPPERETLPIVQEVEWAPRPVSNGAENLAPTAIRSPNHPACSEPLHRLSYPGPSAFYPENCLKRSGGSDALEATTEAGLFSFATLLASNNSNNSNCGIVRLIISMQTKSR